MSANDSENTGADPFPLVRTKLAAPITTGGQLARPTVMEPLLAPHRLVLISAPAGWGKTSLIAAWHAAEHDRRRFAFVRLENVDDVSAIFWTYVVEALRTVRPGLAPDVDTLLRGSEVDPANEVVPALLNDLNAGDQPIVLVLDDYHVIADESIHDSVVRFVDHVPPNIGLAIATRSDPPFPLGALRASGDLVEVRSSHLAFGEVETSEFLRLRFGVELDEAATGRLRQRTEGWPAGLQLAGISLQRESDPVAFVNRFAGDDRNVADYLVGEVLSTLDEQRHRFLLHTALLDQLTGPLCNAVTGRNDGAELLERLERDGLFVIPLDHQRRWYRYHHLLADWLRHELRATDPEAAADLHRRAGRWHEEHGSLDTAIDHALAVPDHDRAAHLLERRLGAWAELHWTQIWRWLDLLPDHVVARHPSVALARSRLAFESGEFSRGLQWVEAAEAGLETLPDPLRGVMTTRLKLWHSLAHLVDGDMTEALRLAGDVADAERSTRSMEYAGATGLLGTATFWLIGALEAIPPLTAGSVGRADHGLNDGGITPLLALAYAEAGDYSAAEATADQALAMPRPAERSRYPVDVAALYAKGKVALAQGDRAASAADIEEGLALARSWVEPLLVVYGCLLLAEASEDYVEKRALVREARELLPGAERRGRIIGLVEAAEHRLAIRSSGPTGAGPVEPFTDREREVLRLLRSDLSLREIAGELYLSHNTIKSYTKSIYRKLGVTSREAAISAADEFG